VPPLLAACRSDRKRESRFALMRRYEVFYDPGMTLDRNTTVRHVFHPPFPRPSARSAASAFERHSRVECSERL
jgi:hypothetical protein